MIQIAVLANHQNGRDTHMRQIKVYTPVEESSIGKFPRCTTIDFMMYRSIRFIGSNIVAGPAQGSSFTLGWCFEENQIESHKIELI
ncbi:hypothetical protein L345_10090 [Ophiophagus hannah]|uniref:Anaphase-promoting complex subunit 10 n=1 Tax=Ophiophagus hannah TaxID=8665 RepID=V8NRH1_OPHHA|nr:hypothetical protein L345_10090 [Ophiophagus hannah]